MVWCASRHGRLEESIGWLTSFMPAARCNARTMFSTHGPSHRYEPKEHVIGSEVGK